MSALKSVFIVSIFVTLFSVTNKLIGIFGIRFLYVTALVLFFLGVAKFFFTRKKISLGWRFALASLVFAFMFFFAAMFMTANNREHFDDFYFKGRSMYAWEESMRAEYPTDWYVRRIAAKTSDERERELSYETRQSPEWIFGKKSPVSFGGWTYFNHWDVPIAVWDMDEKMLFDLRSKGCAKLEEYWNHYNEILSTTNENNDERERRKSHMGVNNSFMGPEEVQSESELLMRLQKDPELMRKYMLWDPLSWQSLEEWFLDNGSIPQDLDNENVNLVIRRDFSISHQMRMLEEIHKLHQIRLSQKELLCRRIDEPFSLVNKISGEIVTKELRDWVGEAFELERGSYVIDKIYPELFFLDWGRYSKYKVKWLDDKLSNQTYYYVRRAGEKLNFYVFDAGRGKIITFWIFRDIYI